MGKLVVWILLVASLHAEVNGAYSLMAENVIKAINFKESIKTRLDTLSSNDKDYTYRLIDVVKLRGDSNFVVLIAKYKDGESYYDLVDILLLQESELEELYNTK